MDDVSVQLTVDVSVAGREFVIAVYSRRDLKALMHACCLSLAGDRSWRRHV